MTKGELERLAVLEQQMADNGDKLDKLDAKMDRFLDIINSKADCTEVDAIRDAQQAADRSLSRIAGALVFVAAGTPILLTVLFWLWEHFAAK